MVNNKNQVVEIVWGVIRVWNRTDSHLFHESMMNNNAFMS